MSLSPTALDRFDLNQETAAINVNLQEHDYDGDIKLLQFYRPHRLSSLVPLFIFLVQGLLESVMKTVHYFAKLGNVLVLKAEQMSAFALEEDRMSVWIQALRRYGSCFAIVLAYGNALNLVTEAVKGSKFVSSEIEAVVHINQDGADSFPALSSSVVISDHLREDIPLLSIADASIRSELLNASIQQVLQRTLREQCLDWTWQFEQTDRLLLPKLAKLAEKNPEKWEATPAVGAVIEGTNFLPMKLMLDGHHEHSPEIVLNSYPNIGLIIDLSGDNDSYNRNRFERGAAFENTAVIYHRSLPLASKSVPSNQEISKFLQIVDDYNRLLARNSEGKLIAVHCHYGFNRTGILICAYLIERMGWTVDEALAAFAKARPPGVKHQNYLDKLYLRYIDKNKN